MTWIEWNRTCLLAEISRVKGHVTEHLGGESPELLESPTGEPGWRTALQALSASFALTPFETDVLLLCTAVELDGGFANWLSQAQGSVSPHPTWSFVLTALPESHWSATSNARPLRRWRLLHTQGDGVSASRLAIDERVLHYLTGVDAYDRNLQGIVRTITPISLADSQLRTADRLAEILSEFEMPDAPVVALLGDDELAKTSVAVRACGKLGLRALVLRSSDLLVGPADREALARSWERESVLGNAVLVVELDEVSDHSLGTWLEEVTTAVIVCTAKPNLPTRRRLHRIDVRQPSKEEQRKLWDAVLIESGAQTNGRLDQAVAHFNLGAGAIRTIGGRVASDEELWDACRESARGRLDDLALRIDTESSWTDLVVPQAEMDSLREIVANVRQRMKVYGEWGFRSRNSRGLGITVLFAGVSGTGKTLAAEVLANELQLDLYRIDLSSVVSKYIGETEKNLARVFDAAEQSGAVLLFDEADALFGKRTEVKDSHDRYANIEVSYLLQRMEQYSGLAILTTNMKNALDQAFLRRIRFVVNFPFPDASQREEIWRRIFPDATPLGNLDIRRLGKLNVAGGNIRNIALGAAFLAAESGDEAVRMTHLRRAAMTEFRKLEKGISDMDIGAWDA